MPDPVLTVIVLAAVGPVLSFAAGGLFVAWLQHRARTGQSPLPLPRPRREAAPKPPPEPRRSNP